MVKICFHGKTPAMEKGINNILPMLHGEESQNGLPVYLETGSEIRVSMAEGIGRIQAGSLVQLIRGVGLFCENIQKHEAFEIVERPVFDRLCASIDMSRNGVLKPETLRTLLCRMALMGYTQVMMYTEDTYCVDSQPFFGYMRGRYTPQELRELDRFAQDLGIELVPCIQTLGHLERFLHWQAAAQYRDTSEVLLAQDEKTDRLIDDMFRNIRKCYHTDKIHVGMDEAMGLGLGNYLRDHGYCSGFEIMQKHISRICEIAAKYGFHPMMWSDMYFRCASKTHDYYEDDIQIPEEIVQAAPKEMGLVYWDYYHEDQAFYDRYIKLHQRFNAQIWFAGGMWTWMGPAVDYDVFYRNSIPGLNACKENGIRNVIVTAWGDDGAECNILPMLLGFQVYAEYCYKGTMCREQVAQRFRSCTGGNAHALERISRFHKTDEMDPKSDLPNACKFLLYQDPLLGLYDKDIEGLHFSDHYRSLKAEFASYAQNEKNNSVVYEFYRDLAAVLEEKSELGLELVQAYQKKDKDALSRLSQQAFHAADLCDILQNSWRKLWFTTNKPNGFEVIEMRLCGVSGRLRSCGQRVQDYCAGRIPQIEELEEERQYILRTSGTKILNGIYLWREIATAAKAF